MPPLHKGPAKVFELNFRANSRRVRAGGIEARGNRMRNPGIP